MTWLAGYDSRIKVTIDNTKVSGSSHTNFPVLIDFADFAIEDFYDNTHSAGNDIRVTASDGTTKLHFEIVSFSKGTEPAITGEMWVKVTTLSGSADTDIYLYYGDGTTTAPATNDADYGSEGVWDDYIVVLHLNDKTSDVVYNSANATTYTLNTPSSATVISGPIPGNALETAGGDSCYVILDALAGSINKSVGTVSYWHRNDQAESGTDTRTIWAVNSGSTLHQIRTYRAGVNKEWRFQYSENGTNHGVNTNTAMASYEGAVGTWTYEQIIWDSSISSDDIQRWTADIGDSPTSAASDTTGTNLTAISATLTDFHVLGGLNASEGWDGAIDEFRLATVARSGDWWLTEWNNHTSSSTFYTIAVDRVAASPLDTSDSNSTIDLGAETVYDLLMETGDFLLLESGDHILLEQADVSFTTKDSGFGAFETINTAATISAAVSKAETALANLSAGVLSEEENVAAVSSAIDEIAEALASLRSSVYAELTELADIATAVVADEADPTDLSSAVHATIEKIASLSSAITIYATEAADVRSALSAQIESLSGMSTAVLDTLSELASISTGISLLAENAATIRSALSANIETMADLSVAIRTVVESVSDISTATKETVEASITNLKTTIANTDLQARDVEAAISAAVETIKNVESAIVTQLDFAANISTSISWLRYLNRDISTALADNPDLARDLTSAIDAVIENSANVESAVKDTLTSDSTIRSRIYIVFEDTLSASSATKAEQEALSSIITTISMEDEKQSDIITTISREIESTITDVRTAITDAVETLVTTSAAVVAMSELSANMSSTIGYYMTELATVSTTIADHTEIAAGLSSMVVDYTDYALNVRSRIGSSENTTRHIMTYISYDSYETKTRPTKTGIWSDVRVSSLLAAFVYFDLEVSASVVSRVYKFDPHYNAGLNALVAKNTLAGSSEVTTFGTKQEDADTTGESNVQHTTGKITLTLGRP